MDNKEKTAERLLRAALSCDSFTSAYTVTAILFAVPYLALRGGTASAALTAVALVIAFAIMPFVYIFIHRADMLLFGRYHLILPVSSVLSAVMFVLAASASGGAAGDICRIFFCSFLFVTVYLSYRYCSFSVRARLSEGGYKKCVPYARAFCFFGGAAAIGTAAGFYFYSPQNVFLNTSYVIAGASLAVGFLQYLITHYGIPRLGGKRLVSVKSSFRLLYSGLAKKPFFSSLLFETAFAALAVCNVRLGISVGLSAPRIFICAGAVFLGYVLSELVCSHCVKRRSVMLSAVCFTCCIIASALFAVAASAELDEKAYMLLTAFSAFFTGIGGAVALKQAFMRMTSVKEGITGGAVYILFELLFCAALAVAFAVAAVCLATESVRASVAVPSVAAAAAASAFLLTGRLTRKEPKTREVTYELTSQNGEQDKT